MKYVRELEHKETPNYKICRSFFEEMFAQKRYENDGQFSWHEQKKKILENKLKKQEEERER